MLGRDDEAASPLIDGLSCKKRANARDQCIPTRMCEPHQQQSFVCPRRVPAHVRKVQILRDQKTATGLSGLPDLLVGSSCKVLGPHRFNIVPQLTKFRYEALGQVLIELDVQRLIGDSAKGRSS